MFKLPSSQRRERANPPPPQPYSPRTLRKKPRVDGATVVESVCPYCAVGCGLNVYTKGGKIIDIEGNPRSPINEGTLCPKGANAFQLAVNPHRVKQVMYRAPYSDRWEVKSLDWAMERIAQRVKETRDADFKTHSEDGRRSTTKRIT
jgi:formate dehydrogenase major subunit